MRNRFAPDPAVRRKIIFGALAFFSVVGWAGVFLGGGWLSVREVEVAEGKGIDPLEAKAAVLQLLDQREGWRPWSPRHAWFVDGDALAAQLKTRWFAESVRVEVRPWSNIVRLIIKEQTNTFLAKTRDQFLRVDAQGVVRDELGPAERLAVLQRMAGRPTSQPASDEPVVELPTVTDPMAPRYRLPVRREDVRVWLTLGKALKDEGVQAKYLRAETGRIVLYDRADIPMYLDPSENLLAQIKALGEYQRSRAGKKGETDGPREFIDARIPGRLYVK